MAQPEFINVAATDQNAKANAFSESLGVETGVGVLTPPAAPEAPTPTAPARTLDDIGVRAQDAVLLPRRAALPEPDAAPARPGVSALWDALWQTEGTFRAFGDIARASGYEVDTSFQLPEIDSQEWKDTVGDLPVDYWEGLDNAVSLDHLKVLADQARKDYEAEQTIAAYGGAGVAGRIATAMLDPVSLAVGISSGGIGWASKGTRIAKALKAAGMAGAENAAIEAVLAEAHAGRDEHDVAYAALSGIVLGGTLTGIFAKSDLPKVNDAGARVANELARREAEAYVGPLGPPKPPHVTAAQRRAEVEEEINAALDEHEAQLQGILESKDALAVELRGTADEGVRMAEETAHLAKVRQELAVPEADQIDEALRASTKAQETARLHPVRKAREQALTALADLQRTLEGVIAQTDSLRGLGARLIARRNRGDDLTEIADDALETLEGYRASSGVADIAELPLRAARDAVRGIRKQLDELASEESKIAVQLSSETHKRTKEAREAVRARRKELRERAKRAEGLIASLRETVERAQKVRNAEIELEQVRQGRRTAKDARDLVDALPKELRSLARERLDQADALAKAPAAEPFEVAIARAADDHAARHAGAAQTAGTIQSPTSDLVPLPEGDDGVAQTVFGKARFDLAAKLRGAIAPVRALVGRYVGDSVGAVDGQVTKVGASEYATRYHETYLKRFHSAMTPAYTAWAKAQGKGLADRWQRATRSEFGTLVTRAIRGEKIDDPHVKAVAEQARKIWSDVLAEAKAHGVKGFEEVQPNAHYVPRVFSYTRYRKLVGEIGEQNVVRLVMGAMREKIDKDVMDDKLLGHLAQGYVTRLRNLSVGIDESIVHGFGVANVDLLAKLLREAKVSDEDIGLMVNTLRTKMAGKEGSVRYAKQRVDLDETFTMQIGGKTFRVDSMFENDVEHLMGRYLRSMSGHIGMARIGVKSFADHQKNLNAIKAAYEFDADEGEKVAKAADIAYKLVTGQPIEDLETFAKWSRFIRDWNFARTMNQSGFAQLPDLAGLFSSAYLKHTLAQIPEFGRMMKRGADGELVDPAARELELWVGVGTDYHNNAVFSMFDVDAEGFAGFMGKVEHGTRVAGRVTQVISGMAPITAFAQRAVAKSITARFIAHAAGGKQIPAKRLALLGLDEDMMKRVNAELNTHAQKVTADSGRKVKVVNFAAWTDLEARDAFLQAIHKEARRLVQEEDVGDTAAWMHKSAAKLVFQFRRFGLVSYTRQTLNGINHLDAETNTRVAVSFALAGMAYWSQMQLRTVGMDEKKKKEWQKKYMTWDRVALAAYARSSFATLTPAIYDSTIGALVGAPAFDVRASGQASDLLTGISAIDLANKAARVTTKGVQSATRADRQFTERDFDALKGLLPFGNAVPLNIVTEALIKPGIGLPSKQRDHDPESIKWAFE